MQTLTDTHQQFASFFNSPTLQPFAYLVSKKISEGHICLDLNELDNETENLPNYYKNTIINYATLANEHLVATENSPKQPFILHNNYLYLQRYFNYESQILTHIIKMCSTELGVINSRIDALKTHSQFIKKLFDSTFKSNQTNWQLVAAISGVLNNFTIITGGPGTGKTTTVAKILAILYAINPNLKVALAAPTGKAAVRMAESLKTTITNTTSNIPENIKANFALLQPLTIQRLLGFIPNSLYFKHNETNPLNYDVVIIDEASMIDVAQLAKLLMAIGPHTRLILLGDKNQLASVEAGSLFSDLCQAQPKLNLFNVPTANFINSFFENEWQHIGLENITENNQNHPLFKHIIELQFSHRFKNSEGIGQFSKAIIQNNQSQIIDFITANAYAQVAIDTQYNATFFDDFIAGYEAYIHESDIKTALQKFNKLRILCAIRESDQGLYALNKSVEKYLSHKNLIDTRTEFYEHRPIIITTNNYTLEIFNGDIGIVRPDADGNLKVWFENAAGEVKSVLPGLINQAETVYAMTIHKSQGSEFEQVLVVLPQQQNIAILTRELLYTGITRAKNKVFLQGSQAVILQAAQMQVKRTSGIAQRFLEIGN